MKSLSLSLLLSSVAAFPLQQQGSQTSQGSSVTSAEISNMALFAQWAGAAYCNSQSTVGSTVTCSGNVCPTANADGATIVATLGTPGSSTDMLGFVAYDPKANQIVVSYRGSSSAQNFIDDIEFILTDCSGYLSAGLSSSAGSQCQLHSGFGLAWDSLSNDTFAGVAAAKAVSSAAASAPIIVTGHSLGGAVATLAAAELRAQGTAVDLYTYGSPRVGNTALVTYLSTQGPVGTTGTGVPHYRVTHTDDPVPQLPPILIGYAHTSPEYWLSDDGTAATATDPGYFPGELLYTPSDVEVCTGYTNTSCNGGQTSIDISAHTSYFEYIGGCISL